MYPVKVSNTTAKKGKGKNEWIQVWEMTLGCVCGGFTEIPAIDLRKKAKK